MKKLITHITSDENHYYLVKEIIVQEPKFFFSKRMEYIGYELLFKDESLDKVKEFETEIHQRFNFAKTTKVTVVEQD